MAFAALRLRTKISALHKVLLVVCLVILIHHQMGPEQNISLGGNSKFSCDSGLRIYISVLWSLCSTGSTRQSPGRCEQDTVLTFSVFAQCCKPDQTCAFTSGSSLLLLLHLKWHFKLTRLYLIFRNIREYPTV